MMSLCRSARAFGWESRTQIEKVIVGFGFNVMCFCLDGIIDVRTVGVYSALII